MAVQERQRPRREGQDARSGKEDAQQARQDVHSIVPYEAGGEHGCQVGSGPDPRHGQGSGDDNQEAEHGARDAAGLLLPALFDQAGVDGDERSAERALAEQVLNQIGNPERSPPRVGERTVAKVVRKDRLAPKAENPADDDAGSRSRGAHLPLRSDASFRLIARGSQRTLLGTLGQQPVQELALLA